MKVYKITIPEFSETIEAENEEEALDIFDFDYDNTRRESEELEPAVEELKDVLEEEWLNWNDWTKKLIIMVILG